MTVAKDNLKKQQNINKSTLKENTNIEEKNKISN